MTIASRVQESIQSAHSGTGPFDLAGAPTGRRRFLDAFASGDKVRYRAESADGTQWERGEGTITAGSPDVLTRDTILESSNANAAVSFVAGSKSIYCDFDIDIARFGAGRPPTAGGTADARTVTHGQPLRALIDGLRVRFRNGAAANATETPTLKIDGTAVKPWRKRDGSAPAIGEFAADAAMEVEYHSGADQWRLVFDTAQQFLSVISPASLSASQNNWNPTGLSGAGAIRVASSNDIDITGLTAIGDTRTLWIHNVNAAGGKNVTLKDESASSTAANRFALPGDYILSPDESVALRYDATSQRWRAAGDVALSSGGTANITAGEALAALDLIYHDYANTRGNGADRWYKVDTDATGPVRISPRLGVALAAISSGASGLAQVVAGRVAGFASLTAGAAVWASTTAGGVTQTEPAIPGTGTQVAMRRIGFAASATEIDFDPEDDTLYVARNSALTVGSSLTVEHYPDAGGPDRTAEAYLVQISSTVQVAQGSGTALGNMTSSGGLAAAFNGTNDSGAASATLSSGSGDATVGKDWGSGTTRTIGRFRARTPSDNSDFTGGGGSVSLKLQGSSDNFASSIVDLWTGTTGVPGGGNYVDVSSGITTTTAYRYHRLVFGPGGAQRTVNEVEFYETTAARNEPVRIGSATIDAAATDCVPVRYDDGAGANAATKTTGINRTNATRDLAFQVVL